MKANYEPILYLEDITDLIQDKFYEHKENYEDYLVDEVKENYSDYDIKEMIDIYVKDYFYKGNNIASLPNNIEIEELTIFQDNTGTDSHSFCLLISTKNKLYEKFYDTLHDLQCDLENFEAQIKVNAEYGYGKIVVGYVDGRPSYNAGLPKEHTESETRMYQLCDFDISEYIEENTLTKEKDNFERD